MFSSRRLPENDDILDGRATDALVASGDCFITIATQLDSLAHKLRPNDADSADLERIIRTLIYLQQQYTIDKKTPNYRQ